MGSLRLGAGSQAACAERGSSARAALPRAARSVGVKCGTAFGREDLSAGGAPSSRMCLAGSSEAANSGICESPLAITRSFSCYASRNHPTVGTSTRSIAHEERGQ